VIACCPQATDDKRFIAVMQKNEQKTDCPYPLNEKKFIVLD
jgi:hypothetical protein